MTPEQATKLRAPFKPEQIGKLPKPTKKDNPKGRCQECGGYHGLPAVHLDYVGHAATTDRLLEVDPGWTWEPMAVGPNGEPLLTNGGLWIKLTVCGVTRPGFGDDGNGKGMKEVIGDAIRNAAMRFGVALDLWSKEDLHAESSAGEPSADNDARARTGSVARADTIQSEPASPAGTFRVPDGVKKELDAQAGSSQPRPPDGGSPEEVVVNFGKKHPGAKLGDLLNSDLGYVKWLSGEKFEPKTQDQRRIKTAAQMLLKMPVTAGASNGASDEDIPF